MEGRELIALLKNMPQYVGFFTTEECEEAIGVLLRLFKTGLDRSEMQVADGLDEKKGHDLINALLERRSESKPHRKRERSSEPETPIAIVAEEEGDDAAAFVSGEEWAWFNSEKHKIQKVIEFGKYDGHFVLFVVGCTRGRGNFRPHNYVVDIVHAKALDLLSGKEYKKTVASLLHGLSKMELTPDLIAFLKQSNWGSQYLQQKGLLQ